MDARVASVAWSLTRHDAASKSLHREMWGISNDRRKHRLAHGANGE
jgi:hypothetical protein